MKSMFASLGYFNYRLWFCCAMLGNTGTWMQRIAQDWLVLTVLTEDSGLAVGIVTALQFGPAMLLSPLAGLLADRLNRRKFMMCTQVGQALCAFALGALCLSGTVELWHVYLIGLALGIITAMDGPFYQTFVTELVPISALANAVGLNSMSFNAARMFGPAVAGLAMHVFDAGWVFVINGLSFASTFTALAVMRTRELVVSPRATRAKGQIRAGLRYVGQRSDIIVILAVVGVVSCLGLNSQLTMAVMARVEFGKEAGQYGILGSVFAVGAVIGALLAARRERPRVRLVVGSALAFGLVSGASALAPNYLTFALSQVAVGLATLTLITAANTTLQLSVEPEMRGRVMSIYMVVFLGSTPIGSPLVGWIAEVAGARWSIGVGAIGALLVGGAAAAWTMSRWRVQVALRGIPPRLVITNPRDRAADADPDQAS